MQQSLRLLQPYSDLHSATTLELADAAVATEFHKPRTGGDNVQTAG